MTSKTIDKENTSFLFLNNKNINLGKPLSNNSNGLSLNKTNSTPVISIDAKKSILNQKEVTNTAGKQRRALGDVLNTTTNRQKSIGLGVTPKVDRTLNVDNTPLRSVLCKSISKQKLGELQQSVGKVLKKDSHEEDDVPPVERFIGSKYDSFNDLFEDGKLSEIYLSQNVGFYTNLNHRGNFFEVEEEKFNLVPVDEIDELERELKRMKKLVKKQSKKEMKEMNLCQELPSLDDLMPKIYEDDDEF